MAATMHNTELRGRAQGVAHSMRHGHRMRPLFEQEGEPALHISMLAGLNPWPRRPPSILRPLNHGSTRRRA